ncbi:MAG: aconitase/3-isopropylmalate dehydratase large subunit family protein [Kiritimatiellia bacterium]|jgi:3-isopropylmalate/(R)-2-methylmalate dehydratase large subunit|nr:aconitase/3-isopropylmalate dehydratase large subunit family protein [Kiritimatiellia bacterium]MDP6847655.1 aconitase/3-isopropylmalate dehydratase large subunit family protein [Kiritimatiellia bacterium]
MATTTEKILARAAGQAKVEPGDNVWVDTDILLTHDVCGPGTIGVFKREFGQDAKVWDPEKVVIIPDHYIFTKDDKAHRNVDILRDFVKEQGLPYYYDVGTRDYRGVCHVALPQEGHVRPGEVIFGTDSHTCTHGALGAFSTGIGNTDAGFILGTGKLLVKIPPTLRFVLNGEKPEWVTGKDIILRIIGDIGVDGANYCAMEFVGETITAMSIEERMTICNMAIEAGGKNGIIHADEKTCDYVKARTDKPFEPQNGDLDAPVAMEKSYDVSSFVPCVAEPSLPSNYAPAGDRNDVKLTRAYIGSCTGGKITDFIMAAKILKGRKVSIDTFLVPATTTVAEGLMSETIDGVSLVEIFAEAGCLDIAPPSCAACLGGPADTFGRAQHEEVVISTTNRNFIGRMGSKQAQIYLASPLTAAASAVAGHITDPREMM